MKLLFNSYIKKSFIFIFVVCFFVQISFLTTPVSAVAVPINVTYSIDGQPVVGNTVNIIANVSSASNLYALSWDFVYDSSMLQILSISPGTILGTNIQKSIISNAGQASIWMSKTGAAASASGSGTLAIIKAKILKQGTINLKTTNTKSKLSLAGTNSCIKLSNNNGTMLTYSYKDISITTRLPLTVGKYENTNSNLIYTGSWSKPTDNTQHYSNVANSAVTFTFQGTGFLLYSITSNNRGIAKIYVDGVAYNADNYTSSVQKKDIFLKNNLAFGNHTVKIVVTGSKNAASSGYYISIDAIQIINSSPLAIGKYENTDSRLTYCGVWAKTADTSQHYSNTVNNAVVFTFKGTGFILYSSTANNKGIAKVYVDGVAYTVDSYSALLQKKAIFTKTGLSSGNHTVKIVVTGSKNPSSSGYFFSIDAVEVR